MSDWVQGVDHSPVRQISSQMLVRMSVTVSPPCFIGSVGMLSIPGVLPLFSACIPASTSSRRIGWSSSFTDSWQVRTLGSPLIWWL